MISLGDLFFPHRNGGGVNRRVETEVGLLEELRE